VHVEIQVTTIAVPRHTAPDPREMAGLLALGFDLVEIRDIAGDGHELRFERPVRRPPTLTPRRTGRIDV
jgi:hypothetical protein